MPSLAPYGAVLRTPHVRIAFASSLVGRLCYGIVSLSLLLTLTAGGHNYGFAGLVMALFGLAIVLASPVRARLVDQHGPRRVLPLMAWGFAIILVPLTLIRPGSAPDDTAIALLAGAAGACPPPLGVVMRTLWSTLVDDQSVLQTAYSLDGVAEELLYVAGPAFVGVLTIVATPSVGLWVTAGLAISGTALFIRSPALQAWPARPAKPPPAQTQQTPGTSGRPILTLAFAAGSIGLCLGGLGLVTVAYSQARHDPAAVAWIGAAMSAGSALGGLAYGAVAWKLSPQRRLALLATGLAALLMPAALSPDLVVLAILVALAGILVSPALATAYVLTSNRASPTARTQAGNWVNSGYNAGSSAGSALSGQLVSRIPLGACLPVLAAPALLAVLPLWRAQLTQTGGGPQAADRQDPAPPVTDPADEIR